MSGGQTLLSMQQISVRFGGLHALDAVDLELEAGEVVGLIGPNGAGKSTLINVLCGMTTPRSGTVRWQGEVLERRFVGQRRIAAILGVVVSVLLVALLCAGPQQLWREAILEPMAEAHRAVLQAGGSTIDAYDHGQPVRPMASVVIGRATAYLGAHIDAQALCAGGALGIIGALALLRLTRRDPTLMAQAGLVRTFQNLRLFAGLTVREHLQVAARRPTGAGDAYLVSLLRRVGLEGLADTPASALAYGQMRRLELARALAARPKLLLLDEPAAGLGAQETALLRALLGELKAAGVAVLLIEHDMDLVMSTCERIVVLDHGQKIAEGTPAQIRAHPEVIAAYLGTAAAALAGHAHGAAP